MSSHRQRGDLPRPLSVSIVGYLGLVGSGLCLVMGINKMNDQYYGLDPVPLTLILLVLPFVDGIISYFLLQGANWARIIYWITSLLAIFGLYMLLTYYVRDWPVLIWGGLKILFWSIMLALPNAHWFFTGRDYRRRPAYREAAERKRKMANDTNRRYDY